MRKSVRREYEYKRSYDFGDFDSMKGRRVTKNRSHSRLRKQLKAEIVAADKEGEDMLL